MLPILVAQIEIPWRPEIPRRLAFAVVSRRKVAVPDPMNFEGLRVASQHVLNLASHEVDPLDLPTLRCSVCHTDKAGL